MDTTRAKYAIAQQIKEQILSLEKFIGNTGFPISIEYKLKDDDKLTDLDEEFIKYYLTNF